MDFLSLMNHMYELLDQQEFAEMAMILRKLWLQRNAVIYEQYFLHPTSLVFQVREELQEYQKAKIERVTHISCRQTAQ